MYHLVISDFEVLDSVEIGNGEIESFSNHGRVLQLGRQSQVMEIQLTRRLRRSKTACRPQTVNTIFVLLPECVLPEFPECVLPEFRCQFETDG
jgi:hypothetical protein